MTIQAAARRTDLTARIFEMIRAYVLRRTEGRSQIRWDEFRETKDEKRKNTYREARQKVCTDAFLALRSRRSREEFRDYFVGTICAVPQYLPDEQYREIAAALATDQWEELRSLAMLALSAHSRV
jgi:CRISPR-associated protein Cmx8